MTPKGCSGITSISRFRDLTDEQVVEFAQAGNGRATEYLLRKYRGFVEVKARSYFLAGGEHEDVVQEGMIGLFKAIRDFRSDKLAHFRSFVELCVTRQIITAVKSASRQKHAILSDCVSLEGDFDEDSGCLIDMLSNSRAADPERILIQRGMLQQATTVAREDLSSLEYGVLRGYLEGRTYQQMARSLRRNPKAIDNALQRAKKKISARAVQFN